ncbi:MAG: methyltransferase domain-containing protein [Flavobacterium sp.]|nr:methyltransferase domain-containing protein [Flavobacterium sp.]
MRKKIKSLLSISLLGIYENLRKKKQLKQRFANQQRLIADYIKNNTVKKLQIGCGSNLLDGWLNTDLEDNVNIAHLDAGGIFPIASESFDFVYSEHLFEHLTPKQQINMLQESHRILKPGGVLRIATPSIDFLFKLYAFPELPEHIAYTKWAMENIPRLDFAKNAVKDASQHHIYLINNFFKAWGHQNILDIKSISSLAKENGFSKVTVREVGESQSTDLQNIEKHGTIIPPQFNLLETMIVEIVK